MPPVRTTHVFGDMATATRIESTAKTMSVNSTFTTVAQNGDRPNHRLRLRLAHARVPGIRRPCEKCWTTRYMRYPAPNDKVHPPQRIKYTARKSRSPEPKRTKNSVAQRVAFGSFGSRAPARRGPSRCRRSADLRERREERRSEERTCSRVVFQYTERVPRNDKSWDPVNVRHGDSLPLKQDPNAARPSHLDTTHIKADTGNGADLLWPACLGHRVTIQDDLYFISIAARMLGMHPQTLQQVPATGPGAANRTIGSMRLYSRDELERLAHQAARRRRRINLAGVQRLLSMAEVVQRIRPLMRDESMTAARRAATIARGGRAHEHTGSQMTDSGKFENSTTWF